MPLLQAAQAWPAAAPCALLVGPEGGFAPEEETIARAEEEEIALLTSSEGAYALAGQLYELVVR